MSHREEKLGWIYLNTCDLFFYSSVSVPAAKKPLDTQNVIKNGSADWDGLIAAPTLRAFDLLPSSGGKW